MTPNKIAWLRFLRNISNDSDPQPTLARVQLLRGNASEEVCLKCPAPAFLRGRTLLNFTYVSVFSRKVIFRRRK